MQGIKSTLNSKIAKIGLPSYKTTYYNSTEEFEAYIASPDYKSDRKHTGVCWGVQHYVDDDTAPNNYTLSLHFPDKKLGVKLVSYNQGVPDQSNPAWLPFTAAPDLYSYFRYQHQGFSFISNMVANKILMDEREDSEALITYLLQPLPTETTITDPF